MGMNDDILELNNRLLLVDFVYLGADYGYSDRKEFMPIPKMICNSGE